MKLDRDKINVAMARKSYNIAELARAYGAISMGYTEENAMLILCQAMFDETIRLRKCVSMREREHIRHFLKEAYLLFLGENMILFRECLLFVTEQ